MPWTGGVEEVRRREIPDQFNETIYSQISLWGEWKRKGWPFTGGWYECQPAYIVDIVDAIEQEMAYRDGKKLKEMQGNQSLRSLANGTG